MPQGHVWLRSDTPSVTEQTGKQNLDAARVKQIKQMNAKKEGKT
jgi:hypothetical protein